MNYYIEYLPKTSDTLSIHSSTHKDLQNFTSEDPNRLSRVLCRFNDWLTRSSSSRTTWNERMIILNNLFQTL